MAPAGIASLLLEFVGAAPELEGRGFVRDLAGCGGVEAFRAEAIGVLRAQLA